MKEFRVTVTFNLSDETIKDTIDDGGATSIKGAIGAMLDEINKESEVDDQVPVQLTIVEWNEKEL